MLEILEKLKYDPIKKCNEIIELSKVIISQNPGMSDAEARRLAQFQIKNKSNQ